MSTPTVIQGARARTSWAQPSGAYQGAEDIQFALDIALQEITVNELTALTMAAKKRERSRSVEVHYWEDQHVPDAVGIDYGTGYTAGATSFKVDNIECIALGDLVRDPATDELILVTGISVGTDIFSGTRDYGQSAGGWTAKAGALADNATLQIVSNAFEPGHGLPTSKSTLEVEMINYCQDIRTPVIFTEVTEDTSTRNNNDRAYQRNKSAKEHQRKLENANIWGLPVAGDKGNYDSSTGNTAPAACGGINHQIEFYADADHKVDQDELTEWEWMDAMEIAFDKGAREKWCFCPPNFMKGLEKWGITRQNTFENTHILGLDINKWQSSGYTTYFVTHELLKKKASTLYNYVFILDMEQISHVTFGRNGSTRLRPAGNHETHGYTRTDEEFQTIQCLILKLPNNHLRLRYKTIAAAA